MKPKKLNLQEITKVYFLLKPAIDNREREASFMEEVQKIVELSNPRHLLEVMMVMGDNLSEVTEPLEFTIRFADSLRENGFFDFVEFIRGLDATKR